MTDNTQNITVQILGKSYDVPEFDCWLRVFQLIAFNNPDFFFHSGYYCWNNRCKTCIFTYIDGESGQKMTAQACLSKVKNGDQVIAVPNNMEV